MLLKYHGQCTMVNKLGNQEHGHSWHCVYVNYYTQALTGGITVTILRYRWSYL